jgi:dephospho-CoA kinase
MRATFSFLNLALTGGIATGKSTVADLWRQRGAALVEADELAHRALEPGTDSYHAIIETFGTGILNPDRTIHRPALGEIVFNNEEKRQALNRIVHPVVGRLRNETLQQLAANSHTGIIVNSIPLLYETGIECDFDCVVTVACSTTTQQARLRAKGLTPDQTAARLRAQWPQQAKMDRADFVIWNDGSLRTLSEQANIIWNNLQEN